MKKKQERHFEECPINTGNYSADSPDALSLLLRTYNGVIFYYSNWEKKKGSDKLWDTVLTLTKHLIQIRVTLETVVKLGHYNAGGSQSMTAFKSLT